MGLFIVELLKLIGLVSLLVIGLLVLAMALLGFILICSADLDDVVTELPEDETEED